MNCDRIATAYFWLEYLVFGNALERCRNRYLEQMKDFRYALLLGDGDGRFLEAFLRINSAARVDVVELSGKMLDLARQRVGTVPRVRFIQADARQFPRAEYDLIVTHFFLDCLTETEIDSLIESVSNRQIRWIVSEFRIAPRGLARLMARALVGFMYSCFHLATGLAVKRLPNHRAIFARYGFHLSSECHSLGGLLVAEIWDSSHHSQSF